MSDSTGSETSRPRSALRGGLARLLSLCNNPVSAVGLFLVGLSLVLLITFAIFYVLFTPDSPYADLVGFMVLPMVFVAGLVIVPIGVLWRWRRERKHGAAAGRALRIDLGDPRTRSAVAVFLGVTAFVVLPVLAVSSYAGYHYTESTEFCAHVCHAVMAPQAVAHARSAHARVSCAECHIGAGADWFVRSKLSGTRQVFAVWLNTYSRPIPPAIKHLRPARDTCEECHWPAQFFGWQYKEAVHFASDQDNTPRTVRMLLKTGGADERLGRVEGIHAHMLANGPIEYIATDEHLQNIPWVRHTDRNGRTTVYRSDGQSAADPPPDGIVRTIDCMDCHNRGAHHHRSPQWAVDLEMETGRIDPSLPFIKREAVAALIETYADTEAAMAGIAAHLLDFYQKRWMTTWAEKPEVVRAAVERVQQVYRENFFPEMKVDWRTYPENVGHMYAPGCFRCHDARHTDGAGQVISSDCTTCHVFLNPVPGRTDQFDAGAFQHPIALVVHENLRCNACHTGGQRPRCEDCHDSIDWQRNRGLGTFRPTEATPTSGPGE